MEQSHSVYWSHYVHDEWQMYLAATNQGLAFVGSVGKPFAELEQWVNRNLPGYILQQSDLEMKKYAEQFTQYFHGIRKEFELPIDLKGTPFQLAVWHALCKIPNGHTSTYSIIAERIGKPQAVRAVGTSIGANPVLVAIPCHRVIAKNGKLSGYRGGLDMKQALLRLENTLIL